MNHSAPTLRYQLYLTLLILALAGFFSTKIHAGVEVLPARQGQAATMNTDAYTLLSQVRAVARMCGGERLPATGPVRANTLLEASAFGHAFDMASRNFFSHIGSDGSSSMQRMQRQGYLGLGYGENIAAGQRDLQEALMHWLDSPGHCRLIMQPDFTEAGIAVVTVNNYNFWTLNMAQPALQSSSQRR